MGKSKGSMIRQMKRLAMKEAGLTYTQRTLEAVRTGKPTANVKFEMNNKKVIAKTT